MAATARDRADLVSKSGRRSAESSAKRTAFFFRSEGEICPSLDSVRKTSAQAATATELEGLGSLRRDLNDSCKAREAGEPLSVCHVEGLDVLLGECRLLVDGEVDPSEEGSLNTEPTEGLHSSLSDPRSKDGRGRWRGSAREVEGLIEGEVGQDLVRRAKC